jgi:hypothetical protein
MSINKISAGGFDCLLLCVLTACLYSVAFAGSGNNGVPYIDAPLVPTSVKPGGAGFTLTVNGTGFVLGSVLNWNGSPRATTFVSKTQLTATVLATDIARNGTASITVSNPAPGGGTSNGMFFPVANQEPAVGMGIQGTCTAPPVASADFNQDGKLDIAVFDQSHGKVDILLGRGNGTFHEFSSYSTGNDPGAAVSGDFSRDGNADLAVASRLTLHIYVGNGDGTFQDKQSLRTFVSPVWLITGDFNEDGNLDIIVAGQPGISIYFGNGDGTFQQQVLLNADSGGYYAAAGDFNDDGHLDLAVSSPTGIEVLLGNGDGTFQNPIGTTLSGQPVQFALADLNGDGKLDLALSTSPSNAVSVLFGNGDGTFSAPLNYPLPRGAEFVLAGDFNGDGHLDLVADSLNSSPGTISTSMLLGNGSGAFGPAVSYGPSTTPGTPMIAGDFNGDGKLDLYNGCAFLQTPRAVTLSQFSMSFPDVAVGGSSSPKQLKLTNSGPQPVDISSISTSGDFSETNDCPATLSLFKGCMISVTFSPTAEGTRTGSLTIIDDAAGSPQSVSLSGKGIN